MGTDKLLAEWFWTDRWIGSSGFLLPMEARGVYREMLTQAWRRGAQLPNDPETIRRAIGATLPEWRRAWPLVKRFWRVEGNTLVNDTQIEIYDDAQARTEKASARGKKGAHARWQANAQATPEQKPPSPSPSPISKTDPSDLRERARAKPASVLAGSLPRDHQTHVFCDFAHCVPQQLHAKLAGLLSPRYGGDREKAGEALERWYPEVVANLPAGFVMGDAFRFWQQLFDEKLASKPEKKSDKSDPFYNAVSDDAVWADIVNKGAPK